MNYEKIYVSLINRAQGRKLESYTEIHHIKPRCMGGLDNLDNLVELTPEEHYLAHQLLVKIYPDVPKLVHAAHLMCFGNNGRRINNKLYGWIKKKLSEEVSRRFSGVKKGSHKLVTCPHCGKEGGAHGMKRYHFDNCLKHPDQSNLTEKIKKRSIGPQSEETKAKRKETQKNNPPRAGKFHSVETKKTMSEIKLRGDNPLRGRKAGPQPRVICPHCNKEGGQSNMTKYHFDKCKFKK